MKRIVKKISGIVLIVAGIIALILPFIPGWLLIVGGIALLIKRKRKCQKKTKQ